MGILLLMLGLLAAGSGAAKLLRARGSGHRGRAAVVEVVAGAAVILGAGLGLARARPLAWAMVAATVATVGWSSVIHVRAALSEQRRRAASEEARFRLFLKASGAVGRDRDGASR